MNVQINQLVRSLLQKDDIAECSLSELQQFADKNPYFGAAQLLLTKKMQSEAPEKYDEQLQKTFLFFNNPLWVQQVLNGTGKAELIPGEKKPEPPVVIKTEEPVAETTKPERDPIITENSASQPLLDQIPEQDLQLAIPTLPVMEEKKDIKEELLFEPFHTVDYFASQGIKLKEEEKPTDKFGQQLKSFTDWLKAMKRLPVTEISKKVEAQTPANAEKKVEQMAAHSLNEGEVVTETMAEVWEKQGNAAKAIEVYQKLSLLDPSKSTYFAAKIADLNKNT